MRLFYYLKHKSGLAAGAAAGERHQHDALLAGRACACSITLNLSLGWRQVLLLENDINTTPFSPAVHACVPPLPWAVTAADVADPNR